jgi:hypothetical protein
MIPPTVVHTETVLFGLQLEQVHIGDPQCLAWATVL